MSNMNLQSLDSLFGKEIQPETSISISKLRPFRPHPFFVSVGAEIEQLVESIRENGILTPVIVRENPHEKGTYEILSGHRRIKAAEILGFTKVPCIIRALSDDDATILMVDSNLAREHIFPSERAFAYKMRMEAKKRQEKRTGSSVNGEVGIAEKIGQDEGKSRNTVYRYIRLTYLIPELLELVDGEIMGFMPGVFISYLSHEQQLMVWDYYRETNCLPGRAQAEELKKMAASTETTEWDIKDALYAMLERKKTREQEPKKIVLRQPDFAEHFSGNVTEEYIKEIIIKLLAKWQAGEVEL